MDTNALFAFVEVARQQSFSKAGDRLYLTQPAISKRIATLEKQLGLSLFDRIGKQVFLTEAGNKLLPKAVEILQQTEDIKRLAANLDNQISGPLTLGTSHHIGLRRLPSVLKRYIRQYPQVDLDIRFMDSEQACQLVHQGELEIAIVTLPQQPVSSLITETIWQDPLGIFTNNDHPLADTTTVSIKELVKYPAVVPGKGTYTRNILESVLTKNKVEANIAMSTNYLETLKMLASIGLGWTLLPLSMGDHELSQLPVKDLDAWRALGIVTNQQRTLSNPAKAIRAMCLD